ncbi:MAG: ABC transporter ATP-binding protein [Candidatus Izemoplasmatales bacterium]|nr:ABC transporter ATP-binding protein [Candidatus Izemoplasmatales bacterium]
MNKIIDVHGLKKSYGPVAAVKGVDFYVEKGKLFAFLGPNGAGKTTTINILCTLLSKDQGEVIIDGHILDYDDKLIREEIGIVFQESVLDPLLTVRENLEVRGSFYSMKKSDLNHAIDEAMRTTDITGISNRRFGTLSGGQRRRTDIARALIHHPKILFLDEPTTGLDPQTRKTVWKTVENLQKEQGMTVFLTTHYMEEAGLADYVIVIDDGLIAAKGTPAELKEKYSSDTIQIKPTDSQNAKLLLEQNQIDYREVSDLLIIDIKKTIDALPIIKLLEGMIVSVQILNGTMDDAFIGIIGKEIRE